MRPTIYIGALICALCTVQACDDDYNDTPTTPPTPAPTAEVVTGSGDVTALVTQFRAVLGEPRNGGAVGPSLAGRREVNWDGVHRFPAAFFNTNVKLGLVLSTSGTGFRNDTTLFGDLDAGFRDQFAAFSPNKVFTVTSANVVDVQFQLAGQPTPARVSGFGAVFVDVDLPAFSTMEFFDASGRSLKKIEVPVRVAASPLSFAGAKFADPIIARVRITLGTGAIGAGVKDVSAGGAKDVVVLDDFLYGEPQPIP
jgi:hypothetical protein